MIKIDGLLLKQMIISGANNLYNCYPEVDALNVFPVPDGDTGTNMNLTISSGATEIANRNESSIYEIARCFSRGLLMGARGNSGVILSQIFRGFAQGLKGKDVATAIDIAEAFKMGKEVAYKAVMRPVEGTILTVIRESTEALLDEVEDNMPIDELFDIMVKEAHASLQRTPNLLPVLKEAGVVDSGGAGLCKILEGFASALHNKIVERTMPDVVDQTSGENQIIDDQQKELEANYCVEFFLQLPKNNSNKKNFVSNRFSSVLGSHGNTLVVIEEESVVKVHIHTSTPGSILTYAHQFGEFTKIKIENIEIEHNHIVKGTENGPKAPEPPVDPVAEQKEFGLISVGVGEGIVEMFKDANCDYVVSGGQTMNPSTEDFVKAIKAVNAKNIFILPNNSNIIMAANQACDVVDGVNATVIPTKTIPQGLLAALFFTPSSSVEDNITEMSSAIERIKSGQITFAIKDTSVDGVEIHKDDFIGIIDKKIVTSKKSKLDALSSLLETMVDEDSSIITIIYGEDVTDEEKASVEEMVNEKYGDIDLDFKDGKQPVYSFIIGVE